METRRSSGLTTGMTLAPAFSKYFLNFFSHWRPGLGQTSLKLSDLTYLFHLPQAVDEFMALGLAHSEYLTRTLMFGLMIGGMVNFLVWNSMLSTSPTFRLLCLSDGSGLLNDSLITRGILQWRNIQVTEDQSTTILSFVTRTPFKLETSSSRDAPSV